MTERGSRRRQKTEDRRQEASRAWLGVGLLAILSFSACGPSKPSYRVYVTNEASGDLTIIDPVKIEALATVPLGKRARGIHPSSDGKLLYVALSGSPLAPPGTDESTLDR